MQRTPDEIRLAGRDRGYSIAQVPSPVQADPSQVVALKHLEVTLGLFTTAEAALAELDRLLGPFRPSQHPKGRLFGFEGERLTGAESRALRGALGLERRHVVSLANALRIGPQAVTMDRLTSWERSKGDGYPSDLVEALESLDAAVDTWAAGMAREPSGEIRVDPDGRGITLRRPVGAARTIEALASWVHGLRLNDSQLQDLRTPNDDFWHALADAGIARAAVRLREGGFGGRIRIQPERDPG